LLEITNTQNGKLQMESHYLQEK